MELTVNIKQIVLAEWNYKKAGEERTIKKLQESIKKHGTYGTIFVREMDSNMYEVVDGNHRVHCLKLMGEKEIKVFNFGKISKKDAIEKALSFNSKRFDTDVFKLAELFEEEKLNIVEIETITGYEIEELKYIQDINTLEYAESSIKQKSVSLGMKEKDYILSLLDKSEL